MRDITNSELVTKLRNIRRLPLGVEDLDALQEAADRIETACGMRVIHVPESAECRTQVFHVPVSTQSGMIIDTIPVGTVTTIWQGDIPPGLKDEVEASIKKWMDNACQPVRGGR